MDFGFNENLLVSVTRNACLLILQNGTKSTDFYKGGLWIWEKLPLVRFSKLNLCESSIHSSPPVVVVFSSLLFATWSGRLIKPFRLRVWVLLLLLTCQFSSSKLGSSKVPYNFLKDVVYHKNPVFRPALPVAQPPKGLPCPGWSNSANRSTYYSSPTIFAYNRRLMIYGENCAVSRYGSVV